MTSAEALTPWPSDDHVPIEELARRQGVESVESLDDLACPELCDSGEEYKRFLADLYSFRSARAHHVSALRPEDARADDSHGFGTAGSTIPGPLAPMKRV